MTEEKKLPTIEEWFEENKNENDCAGMTVGFKSRMQSTLDDSVFPVKFTTNMGKAMRLMI